MSIFDSIKDLPQGPLSALDTDMLSLKDPSGSDEKLRWYDPELISNPHGTLFRKGYVGLGGTPTDSGVNAVDQGEIPFSHAQGIGAAGANRYGLDIAALIAGGDYFGGGDAGVGAEASGFGAPYGGGEEYGALAGTGGGDSSLMMLADAGDTGVMSDVTPGLLSTEPAPVVSEAGAGEFTGAYNPETSSAGNAMNNEPGGTWGTQTTKGGGGGDMMGTLAKYGLPIGLLGASTALSTRKQEMPNKGEYQQLTAEAQAMAKALLEQYKSGTLSPAQKAQLDLLTQNEKNKINSYYASIGQAGSTSHQQALQNVDIQALGVQANMLQTTLNQGLQAIGIAVGPLNAMAQYQMAQDKRLQDAYANFARSAGYLFGMNSTPQGTGTHQQPTQAAA